MVHTSNMAQLFKSVYLPTYPAQRASQRHLRVAFGPRDHELYGTVKPMSSEEIRQLLGVANYSELQKYADDRYLSLNKSCLILIREGLSRNGKNGGLFTDPLIATYRGNDRQLFHHWYPLLEGFQPRFVKTVLDRFSPGAKVVLDPFGGAGTAPLTIAQLGITGFYCEMNPVLQLVTETKLLALQLKGTQRKKLAELMREEAFALHFKLGTREPDGDLLATYRQVFKGSHFFDDETLEDVLRIRTLADEIDGKWPLLGQVFTVAVLASLVSASLMKRAGDLRYKTEEELKKITIPIRQQISSRLEQMATDLDQAEDLVGHATLLAEDARSLSSLPSLGIDAVVTSPPYLNGTNYIRNTKLELWFLRALRNSRDLALWRLKAVTGGINDVTKAKYANDFPSEVLDVVDRVSAAAYDSRIPMMVGSYFSDMKNVLAAMAQHLNLGATLAIDIGDSRYGGIHVETDRLLCDIASGLGYKEIESHLLRVRKSRDGGLLRQNLLIWEFKGKGRPTLSRPAYMTPRRSMEQKWSSFKRELPHQEMPFKKRNWGHPLHSLCSYEGKMKPSLAHFLVDTFVPKGGSMLDPFAGVGTIPFEACLQGKQAFGIELSPAAYAISKAKLQQPDSDKVYRIIDQLAAFIADNPPSTSEVEATKLINFNKTLDQFYHLETLKEILSARRYFRQTEQDSPERALVLACVLHILHGNRPYALSRRSHPITPFAPTGPTEYRSLISRVIGKVERSLRAEYPKIATEGTTYFQDSTLWWPQEVNDLDAIITSPPFFDSTRFYFSNWIRLWFSGWEKEDFSTKPLSFLDTKQKQTMKTYEGIFRQARERLKPGGTVVLHLGKSSKCDMAKELKEIAKPWFRTWDLFEESVAHTETHGVSDKGKVTGHQFLILH